MATLTADGINCSNGTLNGQYTGTTVNNSSYPIGSFNILYWYCPCGATITLNTTVTGSLWVNAGAIYFSRNSPGGSGPTTVAGTWRSRGYASASYLLQRVA